MIDVSLLGWQTLGVVLAMVVLWLISVKLKDSSIIDPVWGLGFLWIAASSWWAGAGGLRATCLLVCVALWALRLAGYLAWRNLGKGEDSRYAALREKYGDAYPWVSLLLVFGLQGLLMLVIGLPLHATILSDTPWNAFDSLALSLWLAGWAFESIGDWQLARFKSKPENRGEVLNQGLWRYTRHPNYFGETVLWWGYFCFAMAAGAPWWLIYSPALMTFLLLRVSGVSMLEKTIEDRRPDYAEYKRRTNAFLPGPPKPASSG